jgi:redox-sensitive bicupin YhaK (pirin superfamily)
VQVVRGVLELNGKALREGDGAAVTAEAAIGIAATSAAELLLFDIA